MRISDWSSDVCSSDLIRLQALQGLALGIELLAGQPRFIGGQAVYVGVAQAYLRSQGEGGAELPRDACAKGSGEFLRVAVAVGVAKAGEVAVGGGEVVGVRGGASQVHHAKIPAAIDRQPCGVDLARGVVVGFAQVAVAVACGDRKSTRLNSSH